MSRAEKFISEHIRKLTQYGDDYFLWITPDNAKEAVEIAREEMIEKACEYVDGLIEILNDHWHKLNKERIIGGLKQAMKDE